VPQYFQEYGPRPSGSRPWKGRSLSSVGAYHDCSFSCCGGLIFNYNYSNDNRVHSHGGHVCDRLTRPDLIIFNFASFVLIIDFRAGPDLPHSTAGPLAKDYRTTALNLPLYLFYPFGSAMASRSSGNPTALRRLMTEYKQLTSGGPSVPVCDLGLPR